MTLVPGESGKAKLTASASGPLLHLPALPLASPVRVQLLDAEGDCWEARYSTAKVNVAGRYDARSD